MTIGFSTPHFETNVLTTLNHAIIKTLLSLKKANKINSFWTKNGKVLAKETSESKPFSLISAEEAGQTFSSHIKELAESRAD